VPPSPIVPNTPFRIVGHESTTSVVSTHQIPYTPFTAFIPRQSTYNIDSPSDSPRAHLLDETDDSLARLYNQLLRFVERHLCRIMSLADKIALATHTESRTTKRDEIIMEVSVEESRGFQIMSNVVWDELGKSLMDEIGVVVFAAGNPKEFRQVNLCHFLVQESLESFTALRNDPSFYSFSGASCTFASCSRTNASSYGICFF